MNGLSAGAVQVVWMKAMPFAVDRHVRRPGRRRRRSARMPAAHRTRPGRPDGARARRPPLRARREACRTGARPRRRAGPPALVSSRAGVARVGRASRDGRSCRPRRSCRTRCGRPSASRPGSGSSTMTPTASSQPPKTRPRNSSAIPSAPRNGRNDGPGHVDAGRRTVVDDDRESAARSRRCRGRRSAGLGQPVEQGQDQRDRPRG